MLNIIKLHLFEDKYFKFVEILKGLETFLNPNNKNIWTYISDSPSSHDILNDKDEYHIKNALFYLSNEVKLIEKKDLEDYSLNDFNKYFEYLKLMSFGESIKTEKKEKMYVTKYYDWQLLNEKILIYSEGNLKGKIKILADSTGVTVSLLEDSLVKKEFSSSVKESYTEIEQQRQKEFDEKNLEDDDAINREYYKVRNSILIKSPDKAAVFIRGSKKPAPLFFKIENGIPVKTFFETNKN